MKRQKSDGPVVAKTGLIRLVLALAVGLCAIPSSPAQMVAAKAGNGPTAASSETGYRLGVFPFLPPLSLDRTFAPIVQDLSVGMGSEVHLRTKPDFDQFRSEIAAGGYDFVFLHPFFYTEAADRYGYIPLARLQDPLKVVILSKPDSGIASLKDLKGTKLALPPKLAAVSKLMAVELSDVGLRPSVDLVVRHYASKMSCIHAVNVGDVDACGLPEFVLSSLSAEHLSKLQVACESRPIPAVIFAAHPRLTKDKRDRFRNRIVSWTETPEGREILADLNWSGFVEAEDRDYDEVRRYELKLQVTARK